MDVAGEGYCQIISLPNPPIEDVASKEIDTELCKVANEAMAELCRKHPDRFPAFAAAINMHDPQEAVREGRRAVKDLGARGWQIFTNVAGRPLDHADYEPVFAMAAELDLPLWLHPARTAADMPDYKSEAKSRYEMWWCFGWPMETTVAMCRLVFWGLFDRYPKHQDRHAPLRRVHSILRRPRRPGPRSAGLAHARRGLFESAAVAEAAAPRLFQAVLRRHRDVRRHASGSAPATNSSAPTTSCSPPTRRSARSRPRSTPCADRACRKPELEKILSGNAKRLLRL